MGTERDNVNVTVTNLGISRTGTEPATPTRTRKGPEARPRRRPRAAGTSRTGPRPGGPGRGPRNRDGGGANKRAGSKTKKKTEGGRDFQNGTKTGGTRTRTKIRDRGGADEERAGLQMEDISPPVQYTCVPDSLGDSIDLM